MAVALVMASSSFLYARDRNRRQNDMVDQPKKDQGHMMQEGHMMSGYSAPARYDVKGAWDVYFTADFIYWQSRSDGVAYGVSVVETTDGAGLVTAQNRVLNVDFGWHPGVKLGIGGNSSRDDWDVYLEWTHHVSHNNTSSTPDTNGLILPSLMFPLLDTVSTIFVPEGSRSFSSWKCIYNTMDLELGRSYYLGKYLTFRPHAGVRGYWIRQRHNNQYDSVQNATPTDFGTIRVRSKYNTWGIGPRFGLNTNWLLGCGFRLFGDVAGSIAWNSVSSRKNQDAPDAPVTPQFLRAKDSSGNANLRPNYDAELGLGWGSYFDNSNWHFDIAIAYEFHYWPDHNFDLYSVDDIFEGLNDSIRGNLGLHGGTLRVRFDF